MRSLLFSRSFRAATTPSRASISHRLNAPRPSTYVHARDTGEETCTLEGTRLGVILFQFHGNPPSKLPRPELAPLLNDPAGENKLDGSAYNLSRNRSIIYLIINDYHINHCSDINYIYIYS